MNAIPAVTEISHRRTGRVHPFLRMAQLALIPVVEIGLLLALSH